MKSIAEVVIVLVCITGISFGGTYGGGSGTQTDPYQIWTAEQMNEVGVNPADWDKHFKLMADIDLGGYTGTSYRRIGAEASPFQGTFDGDGHTISNFTWDSSQLKYLGIFGHAGASAQIMNLGVIDVQIVSYRGSYIGALAGSSGGIIMNCYSTGSITDYADDPKAERVGGLVGENRATGVISGCYSTCSIGDHVKYGGGLVGEHRGTITECYAEGDVTGFFALGGLVGSNRSSISDCYAKGAVVCEAGFPGGLVGPNWSSGTITRCFAVGPITTIYSNPNMSGGIATDLGGSVTNSFWDVETTGISYNNGGTGLTTAEMQTESTYTSAGWDFESVWVMVSEGEDYPHLRLATTTTTLPADFNADGVVDHLDVSLLMQKWGTNDPLCDLGPAPSGDGIVDATDLIVLAEYITAGGAALCGDTNYDGVVDFLDLAELSKNWLREKP